MKVLLIAAVAASIAILLVLSNKVDERQKQFQEWANKNAKVYQLGQRQYRKRIWLSNYYYVRQHNLKFIKNEETYEIQLNRFADLSTEQFSKKYLMHSDIKQSISANHCNGPQAPQTSLPQSIDWAARGAVTSIKNQGQCGSCWAFSVTGALQGAKYKKDGNLLSFSEQQLVDCSTSYGNHGCGGGFMESGFQYVIDHGITTENKYPYKAVNSNCQYSDADKVWQIKQCTNVTPNREKSLMAAIAQQPISVAIQANHLSFQLYKSGIYNGNCGTKLDHGVLAVGYGSQDGKNYYKVKNSWGSSWGAQGYIYIIRSGDGKGKCGIQLQPSFPIA